MSKPSLRKIFLAVSASAMAFTLSFSAFGCGFGNGGVVDNGPDYIEGDDLELESAVGTLPEEKPVSKETTLLGATTVDGSTLENAYSYEYYATNAVGFYGEITDNAVTRNKPVSEMMNGGLTRYPVYGTTLANTDEDERTEIINESSALTATGTANAGGGGYSWMDENGYLWGGTRAAREDTAVYKQLFQHTASVGLYRGDVDPNESGVEKKVQIRPHGYNGYSVTGIYAPAGEVITIKISAADMDATGGLTVHIGQALYNGQANDIWSKRELPRIAHLLNTMQVNKDTAVYNEQTDEWTAYVGSFIGGPLYIRNTSVAYTATISGGVEYPHFVLGYTTKEEFDRLSAETSAPYFDLEVWDYGVLHSGPRVRANGYSYDDLYKAAVLWEKVSSVTTTGSNQGIVMLYDPFVAAGAAVAFPGRRSVNCPDDWMTNSLNYEGIITSGAWGNFHEYHHNFQGYGVGGGTEVTNNGLNLVSYALFTQISSSRGISNYGAANLDGWNTYTSATWALNETLKIAKPDEEPANGNQGLALYATLLHNFGAHNYIQSKAASSGEGYAKYMDAWQKTTHNNMYYYFNDVLKGTDIENNADSSYPMFVPVSCVYQTGRSYLYDGVKKYVKTMQPYRISIDSSFEIDLSKYTIEGGQYSGGSIIIPDGFSYRVKSVTRPAHGRISITDNFSLKYTPDKTTTAKTSGQIVVTLEIQKNDGAFEVDDVDLVLEFETTREVNKYVLERTTYTYTADAMYTDAREAFKNSFQGYETEVRKADHTNPTQNANTDIWFYPDNEANREKYPNVPEHYFVHDNTIEVLDGKLYMQDAGKYRIYLRGRTNCALYYSMDGGKTYKEGAHINESSPSVGNTAQFRPDDPNTYFDVTVQANSWVYIKEVLIVKSTPVVSYIGVGMLKWQGEEAPALTTQPYVNAYRTSYEFPEGEFEADYFYTRSYSYNYADNEMVSGNQTVVSYENYAPYDKDSHAMENLVDGDRNTFIHTNGNVSVEKPLILVLDLGAQKTVNRMILFSHSRSDLQVLKAFKLYGSTDGVNYSLVHEETDAAASAMQTFDFAAKTFRYYKLEITKSSGSYIIIGEIEMWNVNEINGGTQISPDNSSLLYSGEWRVEQAFASFGHVYVGKAGAKLLFEFTGTRIGFLSSPELGKSFEVYIDGVKVNSISLKADNGPSALTYLCAPLKEGKHKVELRCTAAASIDSIIVF